MDYEPILDDIYSSEITRLREQNRVLLGALKALVSEVGSYTAERQYYSREQASKDLDRREKALLKQLQDAKAALTATSQPQRGKGDRALTERVIGLEQALEFAVRGLKVAQPIVCSMCCPSVKRTSEPWTHRQPCDSLTLTLRTVEAQLSQPASEPAQHLCGARGFGQSLDDRCPGCDATSQEGQHG